MFFNFKGTTVLWLFLFVVASCSDFSQKEQLTKVEALQKEVTNLEGDFLKSFPDTLSALRLTMMNTETAVKNKIILDSVDRSFSADMDAYKLTRKKIGPINEEYVKLKKAFSQEKSALMNLYNDINNGWGKRDEYDNYLQQEARNVKELKKGSLELKRQLQILNQEFSLLHPKISALIK